jgi:hypothetical protein
MLSHGLYLVSGILHIHESKSPRMQIRSLGFKPSVVFQKLSIYRFASSSPIVVAAVSLHITIAIVPLDEDSFPISRGKLMQLYENSKATLWKRIELV